MLPFLDLFIKREKDSFITKVSGKKTHTQKYIYWRLNHSHVVKLGVLKGLIHRAHLLCDLKEDLLDELNLLRDVFISNGYPYKLVNKTINESWSTELKKSTMEEFEEKEENYEYFEVMHAPYVQGFPKKLQKGLKRFGVGFVMKKGVTLTSLLCKLKDRKRGQKGFRLLYKMRNV